MYFQYHGMGEVLFHLAQVESLMLFGNSTNRRTKSKLRHMLRHPVKTAVTKKISLAWFETFRETAARRRDHFRPQTGFTSCDLPLQAQSGLNLSKYGTQDRSEGIG